MFPGGSGMRQVQFKHKVSEELKPIDPDDWFTVQSKPRDERIQYFKWRDWHLEYSDFIDPKSAYIEGSQSGWIGPIISFYARQDEVNTFFQ